MEDGIRTTESLNQEITARLSTIQTDIKKARWYRRILSKKHRRRTVRYALLISNAALLLVVVAFVAQQPQTPSDTVNSAVVTSESAESIVSPLDELSSADIAVAVAQVTRIEEATSVTNKADTVNAQLAIAPSSDVITAKPQVIATALKSRFDIQTYIVKEGDDVPSIAKEFGVTSDTIRWSNDLTGDAVAVGKKLIISPINGIVHRVQSDDTLESLASKYSANRDQIATFNDAESGKLPVGEYIVIPNGKPEVQAISAPNNPQAEAAGTAQFSWGGDQPIYGGNGYDYGYCTWYAAIRRAQIGRPIPSNLGNASTWKILAQRAGLGVGSTPAAGAIIWTPPRDYYGHVGFVESVNPDGSVNVSEMNVAGFGVRSTKKLSASQARAYSYIY